MTNKFNYIICNFNSKTLKFEDQPQEYDLSVEKEFVGNRLHLKYMLESRNNKVARVSLYYVFNDRKGMNKWHAFGYKEVPESMFDIDNFYVEPKFRGVGIGTAFLNIIMRDIEDFDKMQRLHSKITFVRMNTPDATAIFNKWNAHENDLYLKDAKNSTRMIIDNPCVVPAKNFIQAKTPTTFGE